LNDLQYKETAISYKLTTFPCTVLHKYLYHLCLPDIDECQEGTHNCAETCTNTDGGFACGCRDPKARLSNDLKTCIRESQL